MVCALCRLGIAPIFAPIEEDKNPGERLAIALEKLGPAYIKFGQILATRSDMLDEDFIRGLSRLKDNVPPFSMQEAEARLQKDFGKPWAEIFKSLVKTNSRRVRCPSS